MSSVDLSDVLFAALSQAAALPQHRLAPWPPASAPSLDRGELADDLRRTCNLGRGFELAIAALAEAGDDIDPALRTELAAHVRDEFADMSERPGSVGAALRGRMFDGLRVEDGTRALQVDWLRPHVRRSEGRVYFALRRIDRDGLQRVRGEVRLPSAVALALPLAPDWRARAEAALQSALAESEEGYPAAIVEALLQALLPETVGGRAGWMLTRGLELLGAGGAPLAEASAGDRRYTLHRMSGEHDVRAASYGTQRWLLRVVTFAGDEVVDIHEREVWAGTLAAEDYLAPAPADESVARAAVEAWRTAAQEYLERDDLEIDIEFLFGDFLAASRPLALLATWVAEGPPGSAPLPPPRATLTEQRLAAAAARVRLLDEAEVHELRERVDDQLLAALELDGWTALFCPCHRPAPGTFQEDRISLRPPGGEFQTILMSDPWNGHVMPIDGDAALFRIVARFWRELLDRNGLDVAFTLPRDADEDEDDEDEDDEDEEDEEDEEDDASTSLRAWLKFPLPHYVPPFPAIDWRVYDGAGDFVADFTFWADGPFAMPPELRARYETAIATHYHAYVRALIDPDLGPRVDTPSR
ncbi:hypothetical protein [Nannocystis punicea]|uniref:Uncharacterized protein n=1 Tax=Nannocystis punicea TaxID=2995304 RepID=A0ABY7GSS2_9BACT|nr:hypothetical protein [Nannocystis poenicansa]WAS89992.1 hypothetical protein O0S08_27680 [Nannocystis poenicansa]